MMGWGMGLGLLFMVLFSGALIALAAWLVRALFPPAGQPPAPPTGRDLDARDILDRRLARGEISQQEYDLMRETLSQ
ncbi:MAG: SHOCT domain-containing protein, partial [Anaerolineae bacterium]